LSLRQSEILTYGLQCTVIPAIGDPTMAAMPRDMHSNPNAFVSRSSPSRSHRTMDVNVIHVAETQYFSRSLASHRLDSSTKGMRSRGSTMQMYVNEISDFSFVFETSPITEQVRSNAKNHTLHVIQVKRMINWVVAVFEITLRVDPCSQEVRAFTRCGRERSTIEIENVCRPTDAESEHSGEDVHGHVGGAEHVGKTSDSRCYQCGVVHKQSVEPFVVSKEAGDDPTNRVRYS
jgi:hypothetical protein